MSEAPETKTTAPVKKRSPAERVLVWGGILILLLVVAIEFRAQRGYSQTLESFSNASDDGDVDLPMANAESFMVMFPQRQQTAVNGIEHTYAYTWMSLFKSGQFQLNVVYTAGDDPSMLRYWTGSGFDPMTPTVDPDAHLRPGGSPEMLEISSSQGFGGGTGSRDPDGASRRSANSSSRPPMDDDTEADGADESTENTAEPGTPETDATTPAADKDTETEDGTESSGTATSKTEAGTEKQDPS
jgi:hypothetical protein